MEADPKSPVLGVTGNVYVVAGTYEKLLYGFTLRKRTEEEMLPLSTWISGDDAESEEEVDDPELEVFDYALEPYFIASPHTESITSVCMDGKTLVSGSDDECLKLFDLAKKVDQGTLIKHEGRATALAFHDNHLLSAAEDGSLCVWRKRDWLCLLHLPKAHEAGVVSMSVHPSGKAALTTGKERSLKMWNLVTGKLAFQKKLAVVGDVVRWSPSGGTYCVVQRDVAVVYYPSGDVCRELKMQGGCRINTVEFVKERVVCVAGEHSNIECYDISSGELLCRVEKAHPKRVRQLSVVYRTKSGEFTVKLPEEDALEAVFLFSCSSDGTIKLWAILGEQSVVSKPVARTGTECRVLCLAVGAHVLAGDQPKKKKSKRKRESFSAPVTPTKSDSRKKPKKGGTRGTPVKKGKKRNRGRGRGRGNH